MLKLEVMKSPSTAILLLLALHCFNKVYGYHSRYKYGHRPNICIKNQTVGFTADAQLTQLPRPLILNNRNCLDLQLPYNSTMLPEYLPDMSINSYEEAYIYIQRWQIFRKLPKCWPYIQRAVCSIMMPEYDEDRLWYKWWRVSRPSVDICNDLVNRNNCNFVKKHYGWPALFNCSDSNLYARNCTSDFRDFKTTSMIDSCLYPLVASNEENDWFPDVPGCTMHCKYPIFNQNAQLSISNFVKFMTVMGLMSTVVALIIIEASNTYNKSSRIAEVMKRATFLHCICYIGWSLQMFNSADIGCKQDGSALYQSSLNANPCVLSFLLIHMAQISNVVWFAYLGKLCHERLLGKKRSDQQAKVTSRCVNMLGYGLPLISLVMITSLGQIDGHGLYGICAISKRSQVLKFLFEYIPKFVSMFYGNWFFIKSIMIITQRNRIESSWRRNLIRIVALITLSSMQAIVSTGIYMYEQFNQITWTQSIYNYIVCSLNPRSLYDYDYESEIINRHECAIDKEPIILIYYLDLLSELSIGIVIASWAWCDTNFIGIRRKLIYMLENERLKQSRAQNGQHDLDSRKYNLTNERVGIHQKNHDVIDMTSPTRVDEPMQLDGAPNTVDDLQDENEFSYEHYDADANRAGAKTPASLGSTSLAGYMNIAVNIANWPKKSRNQIKAKKIKDESVRPRDIVNDQRARQNGVPQSVQNPMMYLEQFMSAHFNPPDSEVRTYDGPQFVYGMRDCIDVKPVE